MNYLFISPRIVSTLLQPLSSSRNIHYRDFHFILLFSIIWHVFGKKNVKKKRVINNYFFIIYLYIVFNCCAQFIRTSIMYIHTNRKKPYYFSQIN